MNKAAFLVVGDLFLLEEKSKTLSAAIQKQTQGDISRRTYRLSEVSIHLVLTEARTLPFLASAQIFRVREAEKLKKEDVEALASYLKAPSETSFLIFESESLAKNDSLVKLISSHGEVYFPEEREKKSAGARIIREKLKYFGKTMTPQVFSRLDEMAGGEPLFLDSILNQLMTYAGSETQITEAMVEAFEEKWGQVNIFHLIDAIASRETGRALSLLKQLAEENNQDLISVIGFLHWQIRRFWQARVLFSEGQAESMVLKRCRISPAQAPFFLRQLKHFSREKLERSLEKLFTLDWKAKTGRADAAMGLEAWLVETTS